MTMPFQHKLSEATSVQIVDERGAKFLELNFKFVRYQLQLDDVQRIEELITLLGGVVAPKVRVEKERVKLPKLYVKR